MQIYNLLVYSEYTNTFNLTYVNKTYSNNLNFHGNFTSKIIISTNKDVISTNSKYELGTNDNFILEPIINITLVNYPNFILDDKSLFSVEFEKNGVFKKTGVFNFTKLNFGCSNFNLSVNRSQLGSSLYLFNKYYSFKVCVVDPNNNNNNNNDLIVDPKNFTIIFNETDFDILDLDFNVKFNNSCCRINNINTCFK